MSGVEGVIENRHSKVFCSVLKRLLDFELSSQKNFYEILIKSDDFF